MSKRKKLRVEAVPAVNCTECSAACCKAGMTIMLSEPEVKRTSGKLALKTLAEPIDRPRFLPSLSEIENAELLIPDGFGVYELQEDCRYILLNGMCAVYDSPERPQACSTFEVGSVGCLIARAKAGFEDSLPPDMQQVVDGGRQR